MFIVVSSGSPGADGGGAVGGEAAAGAEVAAVFALRVVSGALDPPHDRDNRAIPASATIDIR
jgi:hypothetical protein